MRSNGYGTGPGKSAGKAGVCASGAGLAARFCVPFASRPNDCAALLQLAACWSSC